MNDLNPQGQLRQYLLGILEDEVSLGRIEMRLMTDDKFVDEVGLAEADLIEAYLDGELNDHDQKRFDRHFLASPERRRELRLTQNLRKFSAAAEKAIPHQAKRSRFEWFLLPSFQWLRFAALAAIAIAAGLGIWRFAIYESDTDKSLAELRTAYRGQRPLEPRISALPDYVPFSETRGPQTSPANPAALERAEIYLADATRNPAEARAHQALALVYLTQGKYDRATREFDLALAASPKDATIQSDAGAAYLEMAKKAEAEKDGAKTLELLDKSLKHLDHAISLDSKLLPARFNRALSLESLLSHEQAKIAWREYLELDPNSKWADEARRHLERLEANPIVDRSAAELESEYLDAIRQGNEELAAKLLSGNRELIREKYLPQRLAMSHLEASPERRDELLNALRYTGELEMKLTGDPFAREIARFYSTLTTLDASIIRKAQGLMREGCRQLLAQNYTDALASFRIAQAHFEAAEDPLDAALAEYFVGYSWINNENTVTALIALERVSQFARAREYIWLEAGALYWVGGGNKRLKRLTIAKQSFERALALAEQIDDPYQLQRNLLELSKLSSFSGQKRAAMNFLYRGLRVAHADIGARQRYRNLVGAYELLSTAKLYSAAQPIALESIAVADSTGNPLWRADSRGNMGTAYLQAGNIDDARTWMNEARVGAMMIPDDKIRRKTLAFADLKFGELERITGNFSESERHYSDAVGYFDQSEMSRYREEARRGLLTVMSILGRHDALETQIPESIRMTEEFREQLLDEQERTGFFDSRENIYDIAAAFEVSRGNYERAYDYAESSSSRSLLDYLQKGASLPVDSGNPDFAYGDQEKPLSISSIRQRMSPHGQIVQYSVLDEKVLVWIISRNKFAVRTVPINSSALADKVEKYAQMLRAHPASTNESHEHARDLYDILIGPLRADLDPTAEICVIPNKVLFNVPFAALMSPEGLFLLEDFNMVYAPSANVYLRCSENAAKKGRSSDEKLIAVGNPEFERTKFDGMPYLPDAEGEVSTIALMYPASTILTRTAATKTAVIDSFSRADIVHFASHYVVSAEAPSSSYLLLAQNGSNPADSVITNRELAGRKMLRTKLIVLAACRSGIESYSNSEGLIGLSRTFLSANVPLVVGSLWDVDSDATSELMKGFHRYRTRERLSTTMALRRSQLDMLNNPSLKFTGPYYWAAFAVFGGHANF